MAIEREDGTQIDYPTGGTTLQLGDSCLVIGSVEEQTVFDRLTKGELTIPVLPIPVIEPIPKAIVE